MEGRGDERKRVKSRWRGERAVGVSRNETGGESGRAKEGAGNRSEWDGEE